MPSGNLIPPLVDQIVPSTVSFSVGDIVTIKSNITSDCQENITGATVTHEAQSPLGSWESANESEIINEAQGIYNSSWNTSFHYGGYWNLRINSSIDAYDSNSTTYTSWLYLNNTIPTAENASDHRNQAAGVKTTASQ